MSHRKLLFLAPVAVLALLVGVALGDWLLRQSLPKPVPQLQQGMLLTPANALESFTLQHSAGPVTDADLQDHWTLVYVGYTFCPDICPMSLAQLLRVKNELDRLAPEAKVEYWMLSVDPERDTPERLDEYTNYFDPSFVGVTGEREQIDHLARQLGAVYRIHPPEEGSNYYLVDHSSNFAVINPRGELAAVLTPPHEPPAMAEDLLVLLDYFDS